MDTFCAGPPKKAPKADKRMSVERIYQKKSQLEHILLRPDTYIGSVQVSCQLLALHFLLVNVYLYSHPQTVTEPMWVYDDDKMVHKETTYVPGFYKIFDEILVNAADNKQRDAKMDTIKYVTVLSQPSPLLHASCQGGHQARGGLHLCHEQREGNPRGDA